MRYALPLLFVLLATPAFAQEHHRLHLAQGVFIAANVADIVTTERGISSGAGREANVFMQGSTTQRIIWKSATTVGVLWLTAKIGKDHPRLAQTFLYTVSGVIGAVAVHNNQIARGR